MASPGWPLRTSGRRSPTRCQRRAILDRAGACSEEGVAVAVFPRAGLVRLRDRRPAAAGRAARRRRAGVAALVEGSAALLPVLRGRRAAAPRRPALQHARVVDPSRPAARRRAEDPPAELPRVLRAPAVRLGRGRRGERSASARIAGAVRHRPAVRRRGRAGPRRPRRDLRGLLGAACRPARGARWPARPCSPTSRPATSPSARPRPAGCSASRNPRAASPPTSTPPPAPARCTTDLAWDGQASIFENGVALAETERFPPAAQIAIADVDLDLLRQERARQGTFDDNRRHSAAGPAFRARRASGSTRRPATRPAARGRALPLRAGRPGAARAGLLRGLQHPGRRPGAAAARDRASSGRDRRLRRARFAPRR